jgi:hypothetical protein
LPGSLAGVVTSGLSSVIALATHGAVTLRLTRMSPQQPRVNLILEGANLEPGESEKFNEDSIRPLCHCPHRARH